MPPMCPPGMGGMPPMDGCGPCPMGLPGPCPFGKKCCFPKAQINERE